MTFHERVSAIVGMGFTPRQARFVTLVALHSGYCPRQYAAFAGVQYGKNVRDFLDGLVERRLARRLTFRRDRGHIYHLFARSVYSALRQDDNRNRRLASPALIARKLMLLDYVLTDPGRDWYATETEKVDLFLNTVGVPRHALPQRTYHATRSVEGPTVRYCVQKLPVFLTPDPDRVHFVCLVTDPAARDIALFVREHASLLAVLPKHRLVAVRPDRISSDAHCRSAYVLAIRAVASSPAGIDGASALWYLEARTRIERGEIQTLSVSDIQRYRSCRGRAAGMLDAAYSCWVEQGSPAFTSLGALFGSDPAVDDRRLVVTTLPYRYEQFGALPGIV